jgi:hypothetical protein
MPLVGFEPTIPVFERAKTFHFIFMIFKRKDETLM